MAEIKDRIRDEQRAAPRLRHFSSTVSHLHAPEGDRGQDLPTPEGPPLFCALHAALILASSLAACVGL